MNGEMKIFKLLLLKKFVQNIKKNTALEDNNIITYIVHTKFTVTSVWRK